MLDLKSYSKVLTSRASAYVKSALANKAMPSYSKVVLELKEALRGASIRTDAAVESLALLVDDIDISPINDVLADSSKVVEHVAELTDPQATLSVIREQFARISDADEVDHLTLTDNQGHVYAIYDKGNGVTLQSGETVILSSIADPSDVSDALIFIDNAGHYKVSRFIKSVGFETIEPGSFIEKNTDIANIVQAFAWLNQTYTGQYPFNPDVPESRDKARFRPYQDVFKAVVDFFGWADATPGYILSFENSVANWVIGVRSLINNHSTYFDGAPYTPLIANSLKMTVNLSWVLWHNANAEQTGVFGDLGSIAADLTNSATVDSMSLQVLEVLSGSTLTIAGISAIVGGYLSSDGPIGAFASKLVNSFNTGGLSGIVSFLGHYYSPKGKLEQKQGTIQFTDTASLTMISSLAGCWPVVLSTIGNVISVAGVIFGGVVGAVAAVAGQIVSFVGSLIGKTFDQSYAYYQNHEKAGFFLNCPILQLRLDASSFENFDTYKEIINYIDHNGVLYFDVCGATVKIGFLQYDPSIIVGLEVFPSIYTSPRIPATTTKVNDSSGTWISATFPNEYDSGDALLAYWSANASQWVPELVDPNADVSDQKYGRLNSSSDAHALQCAFRNAGWFWAWLLIESSNDPVQTKFSINNSQGQFNTPTDPSFMILRCVIESCVEWSGSSFIGGLPTWTYFTGVWIYVCDSFSQSVQDYVINCYRATSVDSDYTSEVQFTVPLVSRAICLKTIASGKWVSDSYSPTQELQPMIITPKYTRAALWASLIITTLVVAAAAAVTVFTTMKVKRVIAKKRAVASAKVESAWSELTKHPDAEHYEAYRQAVKKNNRFTKVFGGTKYSKEDYWQGDVSSSKEYSGEDGHNVVTSLLGSSTPDSTPTSDPGLDLIVSLIRG